MPQNTNLGFIHITIMIDIDFSIKKGYKMTNCSTNTPDLIEIYETAEGEEENKGK